MKRIIVLMILTIGIITNSILCASAAEIWWSNPVTYKNVDSGISDMLKIQTSDGRLQAYCIFNFNTGAIEYFDPICDKSGPFALYIPASINNIKVTGIDDQALCGIFYEQSNMWEDYMGYTEVYVPSCIINFGGMSFYPGYIVEDGYTICCEENSAAYQAAQGEKIKLCNVEEIAMSSVIDWGEYAVLMNDLTDGIDVPSVHSNDSDVDNQQLEVESGKCGDNLVWTLDASGRLEINGTGEMEDYTYSNVSPWKSDVTSAIINSGVSSIGIDAFWNCSTLSDISIPNSVTSIKDAAFYNCKSLSSIKLPNSIVHIGSSAFDGCEALENVIIPNGIKLIDEQVFCRCNSFTNIEIPNGVEDIGRSAFCECESLSGIIIPESVNHIAKTAFYGCESLQDIYYSGTQEQWNKINIETGNEPLLNATIHYSSNHSFPASDNNTETSIQDSQIKVYYNDAQIFFDQQPIIQDGRTLVPLRAIFEALGATVDWNGETKTVTAKRNNDTVSLTIGSNILYKNSGSVELDVPAQIVNDRTLVPARAIAEAFGCNVGWNGDTRTVTITE